MLTSTFDNEKKVPITQQVGSENGDYHHHHHHQQQGVSLQDEEEDKAAEKRVLRKIDLIVLPMVRTSLNRRACARNHKKFILQLTNPLFFNNQNRCVSSSSRNTSTNNPSPTLPSTVSSPISISTRINSAGSRAASISPNSLPKALLFIS